MSKIVLSFLLLFVATAVQAENPIPGTSAPATTITEKLPWKFNLNTEKAGSVVEVRYRSRKPIRKTNNGGLYLRSSLTSHQFKDANEAAAYFDKQASSAHPDMGLSYAWDYLTLSGNHLHHLYAGCSLSKKHFRQMVRSLEQALDIRPNDKTRSLFCRCGGGCK